MNKCPICNRYHEKQPTLPVSDFLVKVVRIDHYYSDHSTKENECIDREYHHYSTPVDLEYFLTNYSKTEWTRLNPEEFLKLCCKISQLNRTEKTSKDRTSVYKIIRQPYTELSVSELLNENDMTS